MPATSTLWILFLLFAALAAIVFIYAFRRLGPSENAEKRVMELQDQAAEDEE